VTIPSNVTSAMAASDVLRSLALPLPAAPKPVGAYTPFLRDGRLLYTSGHLPLLPDGTLLREEPLDAVGMQHGKVASHLMLRLPPGTVTWSRTVTSLDRGPDGRVRAAFLDDGSRIEADVFLAADGNRSAVRNILFPGLQLKPERVNELVCLLQAPDIVERLGPSFLKFVDAGRALSVGVVPCSRNHLVWFMQVPSDNRFEGRSHEARHEAVRRLVGDWAGPVPELIARTQFGKSYLWRTTDIDPLPSLSAGNVAFVGDAGHPLLPFTSQGVASALTDAAALGDLLDESPTDIDGALARYSEQRLPETTGFVTAGRALQQAFLDRDASPADMKSPFAYPAAHPQS